MYSDLRVDGAKVGSYNHPVESGSIIGVASTLKPLQARSGTE